MSGVRLLPVFPLELVLMPNEIQFLHIFEPRYRRMLGDICDTDMIFGLSYYRGDAVDGRPAIDSIGCAALVRDIDLLPDGRSNIDAIGATRYRILRYVDAGTPYLTAEVEFFDDDPDAGDEVTAVADEVFELFQRLARAAREASGQSGELPPIVQAPPEALSFLVAAAFGFATSVKYRMIQLRSTKSRLEIIRETLRDAVGRLESDVLIKKIAPTNGHAKKKIDL